MRILLIVLAAFAMTGCLIGNKHRYDIGPDFAVQGTRSVAVAAQDLRRYVVSKEKKPDFVGFQRGNFGNPFDITTESGRPLADDFAAAIAASLQRRGFNSTAVSIAASPSAADARALAARASAERLALLQIVEWMSDTTKQTGLLYDLVLRVYDADGNELANNRVTGRDNLGGSAWNPPDHAKGAVPVAYRKKLEELFGAEAVLRSLR